MPRRPSYPRQRRGYRLNPLSGGAVTALPIVTTVGVNAITASSASLVGSVNPNGLATSWWFTYGTTQAMGTVTATVGAGAGTTPVTVGAPLVGLTPNTLYYFALVGTNVGGTVLGAQLSFTPAAPVQTNPPAPVGQLSVTIPHFAVPVRMVGTNGMAIVEQNTEEDVLSCVRAIVDCPVGACPEIPNFGIPDTTFAQEPIDPSEITSAIANLEPRATESATSGLLADGTTWGITLQTGVATDSG